MKTTLLALNECWPDRRKVVVFQPHRYTRTQALFTEFTRAFYQSDVLFVMPIYAASEQPIAGVNAALLCEAIKAHGHKDVRCVSGPEEALQQLDGVLAPDDILLTLGAGDVWKIGEQVLAEKP